MTTTRDFTAACIAAQVERAARREQERHARLLLARAAAEAAAAALRNRYGSGLEIVLFGSAVDGSRFRRCSDVDIAVGGLPPGRLYEASSVAEAAARRVAGIAVDLVDLDASAVWLRREIHATGAALP